MDGDSGGVIGVETASRLAEPFPEAAIRWRTGRAGMQFAYITARQVMDRLDGVVGVGGWGDEYRVIDPAAWAVECRLTVLGVTKADIGYPNNPDREGEQEPLKAAYSDAFKRAAVRFGVGRFLYDLGGKPATFQGQSPPPRGQQNGAAERQATLAERAQAPVNTPHDRQAGAGPAATMTATEPQLKAILAIGRAQGMDNAEIEERCQELYGGGPARLSRRQASEFIDHIKGSRGGS